MKRKGKTALFLLIWTAVLGGVYLAFSGTSANVFVSMVYAVAGTVLFVFFLLVNGGFRSLPGEERKAAERPVSKELHGKKKRGREPDAAPEPRPDLFHLGPGKQERAAKLLLTLAIPFFFILIVDWFYLHFIFKG